jgi:hypothetical protein
MLGRASRLTTRQSARGWIAQALIHLEPIQQSDAHFGLVAFAGNWAGLNVATKSLIKGLAKKLPIFVDVVAIKVVDSNRAQSTA